jgi:hypothetical protein
MEHDAGGTPVPPGAVAFGLNPGLDLVDTGVDDTLCLAFRIPWFGHGWLAPPPVDRMARQGGSPGDLAYGELVAEMHPPDLGKHAHCDHSSSSCSFVEQAIESCGPDLDENYCREWGNFQ